MLPIDRKLTVTAHAKGANFTESGTKKTPQIEVLFEIDTPEFQGEQITWYGFLTDKAVERTLESLRYAGWKSSDINDLTDLSKEDVPGVELVIEPDTYNGDTKAKVQWVNRAGGRGGNTISADKAKEMNARLRASLAIVDAKLKKDGMSMNGGRPPV